MKNFLHSKETQTLHLFFFFSPPEIQELSPQKNSHQYRRKAPTFPTGEADVVEGEQQGEFVVCFYWVQNGEDLRELSPQVIPELWR